MQTCSAAPSVHPVEVKGRNTLLPKTLVMSVMIVMTMTVVLLYSGFGPTWSAAPTATSGRAAAAALAGVPVLSCSFLCSRW